MKTCTMPKCSTTPQLVVYQCIPASWRLMVDVLGLGLPYTSAMQRCARSVRPLATWPGSLATPLPKLSGDLRSWALARASGRACRPGQRPQPPDRWGFLLGLRGFREGHELPKGQQGQPCGDEATERGHPAIDRGHQPVQQETETQPTPADPPQEESKHGDAAQHSWTGPFPRRCAAVGVRLDPLPGSIPDASAPSRATHGPAGARPCV